MHLEANTHTRLDFVGGGEMGRVIAAKDWSRTPLGPVDGWSPELRTAVSLALASTFPISIAWGPGHVQIYNDGYWPICGAKHPTSMGQDFRECWASAFPVIGEAYARAWSGDASYLENQRMFLDRYGYLEETFFTFSFSPIRDASGNVAGLFHPVTETTPHMLSERRVRALRDLAARTGDAKSVEEACRQAARTLAGYDLDLPFVLLYGASGDVLELVAASGVAPGHLLAPERAAAADDAHSWPFGAFHRDGELVRDLACRFGDFSCGPYPEAPGAAFVAPIRVAGVDAPVGLLVAGVSARLALDTAYRGFYELLSAAINVVVGNARAYEAERRRAEALADIDRAKTAFFSNVSHEFRTPLTLMFGPTEDLLAGRHGPVSAEQRAQLELLRRNELRLQRLVNALLEFSRIEAGRINASYEPVDLAAMTRDLAASFRSAVERAGLELIVDCEPLDEPVYVDRDMWEQIVLNLLSNAFKFTFEGSIRVSLRSLDGHVALSVEDTGVGVRPRDLPRLFERFQRIEGTPARTHEGSGIGLALVQELARLHGGDIEASSRHGHGTCFTVTLPTGTAHLPKKPPGHHERREPLTGRASAFVEEALRWIPDAEPSTPSASEEEAPASLRVVPASDSGRARVLIADDNADMRDYLRRLLSPEWSVETVSHGRAALAAARRRRPDIIVSDIMMPILDGFGLLRELRDDPELAGIPVIMLSARAGEEARVEGLEAGADDYLTKPFSARELVARLRTHLKLSRVEAALERQWDNLVAIMRDAPVAISLYAAAEDRYELVNQAHIDMVGRDVTGLSLDAAFPDIAPDVRAALVRRGREIMRSGETAVVEEIPRRAGDGTTRYFNAATRPWADVHGQRKGLITVAVEVTEQVRARQLAEAAHEQGLRSEGKLREALAMRDEFLTIASHELRTPLTTLGLQTESLLRGLRQASRDDPPIDRWLQKAERLRAQARRLESLIEGMLQMFDVGRARPLEREPLDLADVARSVVQRLSEESRQARLNLRLRTEPAMGRWDRRRLEQILTHLLRNALKFGNELPVEVAVTSTHDRARISVKDRGIGIARVDQRRIFDRFERAAPTDEYGGFGLGLWVVDELVRAMDGTVRVESEPQSGATFVVELPRLP